MEKDLKIIEIEEKEYIVFEEFQIEDNKYWIICELLEDEEPSEEVEVVRVDDENIYAIEDEKEQELVKQKLDELMEEIED